MNVGAEIRIGEGPTPLPPGGLPIKLAPCGLGADGPFLDAFRLSARILRRLRFAMRAEVKPFHVGWNEALKELREGMRHLDHPHDDE